MRKYETKTITREEERIVETACDLCGVVAKYGKWESSCYVVAESEIEVTIKSRDGVSYPDCGYGTKYNVDMCPKCFKEKLVPWLQSQGVDRGFEDWEW